MNSTVLLIAISLVAIVLFLTMPARRIATVLRAIIPGLMVFCRLACYSATIVIGLIDASVLGFWGQLVLLGVGWNFLFVSGTALLPSAYEENEQFKAQALNDTLVFSMQAIASLSAGWVMSAVSWSVLLLLCTLPMALLLVMLLMTYRQRLAIQ